MVAAKKYRIRYTTAVSMEQDTYDLTRDLEILLSDALQMGVDMIVQMMISQKSEKITAHALEIIAANQIRMLDELRQKTIVHSAVQAHIDRITELQKTEQEDLELIRVYDPDQELIVPITRKLARELGLTEYAPTNTHQEAP